MSTKVHFSHWLLFILIAFASFAAHAKESKEADFLALAALMIRDGDYLRARDALEQVDITKKNLDKKRYFTLRGLIDLESENYRSARDNFRRAISEGQDDKIIHVYLAQAHYGLKEYNDVLDALSRSGEAGDQRESVWLLKASTYRELGNTDRRWQVLREAEQHFPEMIGFVRRQIFLLIELGLHQEAVRLGLRFISEADVNVSDYLAIGHALTQSGQENEALTFLEQAIVRYPGNKNVVLALAHVYVNLRRYQAAASLLENAAYAHPELWGDAAELWKKAHHPMRALFVNSMVVDQRKKFKQRLALLLESERFDDAIEMENDLYRVGLLDDQNIGYALAYAFYKTGLFLSAHEYLDSIVQPALFAKATTLRAAMESCADNRWQCFE